jgi:hypothetical protein
MGTGNTTGRVVGQPAAPQIPAAQANPTVEPETPKEKSLWERASPWVHGALGVASFVPGLSVITGGLDAGIYAAEGNYVEAGLSAASMIPGGKIATTVGKGVKAASGMVKGAHAAEEAVKLAKVAREAEEAAKAARLAKEAKLAKEAEEAARLKKLEEEAAAAKKAEEGAKVKKQKPGPCDHLRQGNGKGPYRGGAHSKTSKPVNDGKDSHHAPADDVSPLARKDGPAIQMHPNDHKQTSSRGSGTANVRYREMIEQLIKNGEWRKAMAIELKDIRDVAKNSGDARKYNEAMLEMLEYFKCLEKNALLPVG